MNQRLGNKREAVGTLATNIENPRVGGSIPPQATIRINHLAQPLRLGFVVSGFLGLLQTIYRLRYGVSGHVAPCSQPQNDVQSAGLPSKEKWPSYGGLGKVWAAGVPGAST